MEIKCTVAVIISNDKFSDIVRKINRKEKFDTSYGIPFLELPFKFDNIEIYTSKMIIVQNNIRYIVFGSKEYEPSDFRGYRFDKLYLDRTLELSNEVLYTIAPCFSIRDNWKDNELCDSISYKDLIKFI